jgi:hypothetical protein
LAFGNPPKAMIGKVPQGKALITFYSTPASSNPFIGQWSIVIGLVDMKKLED